MRLNRSGRSKHLAKRFLHSQRGSNRTQSSERRIHPAACPPESLHLCRIIYPAFPPLFFGFGSCRWRQGMGKARRRVDAT